MTTSDIGVDTVIETGNSRFGQNRFGEDFSYLHTKHYNGVGSKSKGLLVSSYLLGEGKAGEGKSLIEAVRRVILSLPPTHHESVASFLNTTTINAIAFIVVVWSNGLLEKRNRIVSV